MFGLEAKTVIDWRHEKRDIKKIIESDDPDQQPRPYCGCWSGLTLFVSVF